MKNLFVVLVLTCLSTVVKAEKWLVIISRGNTITMLWMDEKPFKGEGVTILGPFANAAPNIVDGLDQAVSIKEGVMPPLSKITKPNDLSTQTGILVYAQGDKIHMVTLSEGTDWKALLQYFQAKNCTDMKCQIIWTNQTVGKTVTINEKPVAILSKDVTSKHGDILIDDVIIDPF
jgi:hypothetical protein